MDLRKILKYCPEGWKFYSTIFGDETCVLSIDQYEGNPCPITIYHSKLGKSASYKITRNGHPFAEGCGECCLFPSREMRDWSKFSAYWYKNENLIKPKFKVGDIIRHKNTNDVYKISEVYYDFYGIDGFDWGIYINNQDKYELVSNKFDPKTLKPFDKVLVRDSNLVADSSSSLWKCQILSHIKEESKDYPYVCINEEYSFCIPFNDDTKHLVGTNKQAPEFYRYWEN